MSDLISRQAAIDTLSFFKERLNHHLGETDFREEERAWGLNLIQHCIDFVRDMPSAQICNTCRYNSLPWYEEPCDSCTGGGESNHWKPSADVVEVVRCKDCKYSWHPTLRQDRDSLMCNRMVQNFDVEQCGYCSCGERREDE